jgi:NitT/TauT family transport system substrate-binding protein
VRGAHQFHLGPPKNLREVAGQQGGGVNRRSSTPGIIGLSFQGNSWVRLLKFVSFALLSFILVMVGLMAGSLAEAQETGLSKVTFIPQWIPQAQFAGYYVAFEKGIYRQHHLDVKILAGGPEKPASDLLAKGKATFGTLFLTDGIEKRAQGFKLINIAQIVQRSAFMLVAKKSSGITAPEHINGRRVGLWRNEFQVQPQAFFRAKGLKVKVIPQAATLNLFLRGGVEVASAMWYNEYHQLLNSGVNSEELTTFLLADYGMNFPEDGIYCLADLANQHPRTCRAFVAASIEGWMYAFAQPDEALDIVMQYVNAANVASDRVHQKWMLERMRDIILPPGTDIPMGTLRQATYEQVAQEMQRSGTIKEIPEFSSFYKDFAGSDAH